MTHNMVHNTPKVLQKVFLSEKIQLPEKPLEENSIPFPIASNISVGEYNSFAESQEISGYKLEYIKGTVYIVEMGLPEHRAVIELIGNYFRALCFAINATLINSPIQVRGQSLHNAPDGTLKAPDLTIYPNHTFIPPPPIPGPPSDIRGNPHARVMLEVAATQSSSNLKDKCRLWKRQSYVRSILGIKLYDVLNTRNAAGYKDRVMKAILWRQGVARQKWYFGTVNKDGSPTDCNDTNNSKYIIKIPASDVFYDPAATGPGYTYTSLLARPPPELINATVAIDLYEVQQMVLMNQQK